MFQGSFEEITSFLHLVLLQTDAPLALMFLK